jgi:hypothetical protein
MMFPGLISLVFYRRWPSRLQIVLGLVPTVLLCGVLGYVSPTGGIGRDGTIALAVVGGVLLYFAILAYFYVRAQARRANPGPQVPPSPPD